MLELHIKKSYSLQKHTNSYHDNDFVLLDSRMHFYEIVSLFVIEESLKKTFTISKPHSYKFLGIADINKILVVSRGK